MSKDVNTLRAFVEVKTEYQKTVRFVVVFNLAVGVKSFRFKIKHKFTSLESEHEHTTEVGFDDTL